MEIKMNIIYEKADGLIQASVAELPGAISLGATVEEARRNLDEAIEMVLEGNRLLALHQPPDPKIHRGAAASRNSGRDS